MNLGIYGVPPSLAAAPDDLWPMAKRVRKLEGWLRGVKGMQHTYCDSFQTEMEFKSMFDHTLNTDMRRTYGADGVSK